MQLDVVSVGRGQVSATGCSVSVGRVQVSATGCSVCG